MKPQTIRIIDKRRSIYAEPISTVSKFLYIYLADRANTEGTCYPGRDRIAEDLSASVSTVGRALAELIEMKLVVVKSNGSDAGTNLYHIYSPDRRSDAEDQVGHTDPPDAAKGTMKGHTDPRGRSHRPALKGHSDLQSNYSVEVDREEEAAAVSRNGSRPKAAKLSTSVIATLPSRRITFNLSGGAGVFCGINDEDRARWKLLAPDADLDYELVKAADHALNTYEADPVKRPAAFLSNWMKGAQRRIAEGRQPKGASRAPAARVDGPVGLLAL